MYYFKNKCEGFIKVSKHKKTDNTFIVFECLETPMKPDAQVFEIAFEIASQSHLKNKRK